MVLWTPSDRLFHLPDESGRPTDCSWSTFVMQPVRGLQSWTSTGQSTMMFWDFSMHRGGTASVAGMMEPTGERSNGQRLMTSRRWMSWYEASSSIITVPVADGYLRLMLSRFTVWASVYPKWAPTTLWNVELARRRIRRKEERIKKCWVLTRSNEAFEDPVFVDVFVDAETYW